MEVRPLIKYHVIYDHRNEYSVSTMCRFFHVSRSGYYDFVRGKDRPDKNAELVALIREQQTRCFQTYGYRRMHLWLKSQQM